LPGEAVDAEASQLFPMLRGVLTFLVAVAGVYALLVGGMYTFQRSLLFPASQYRAAPAQMAVPEMSVVRVRTSDGLDLAAWYHPAPPGRFTILSFHGNGDFLGAHAPFARKLIDEGHGVMLATYRDYSGNPGEPSEEGLRRDGQAAMAFLEERGAKIVLHGFSLGAAVAIRLAIERPVAGVILEAPFTAAVDVAAAAYPIVPVRLLMKDRFESLEAARALRVPVLVAHGSHDEIVPLAQSDALYAAISAPKMRHVVEGATHNDLWVRGGGRGAFEFLRRLEAGQVPQ
jgi:fermentation-respiration switch protein FrsA (DUF1100 family)